MLDLSKQPFPISPMVVALTPSLLGKAVKGLLMNGYSFHVAPGTAGQEGVAAIVDGEQVGLPVMTFILGNLLLSHIATAAMDSNPQVLADLLIHKQVNH